MKPFSATSTTNLLLFYLLLQIKAEAVAGTILAVIAAIAYKADNLKPIKFSEAIVEDELAGKGYVSLG